LLEVAPSWITSAARSAMAIVAACVWPRTAPGMTDASTTRTTVAAVAGQFSVDDGEVAVAEAHVLIGVVEAQRRGAVPRPREPLALLARFCAARVRAPADRPRVGVRRAGASSSATGASFTATTPGSSSSSPRRSPRPGSDLAHLSNACENRSGWRASTCSFRSRRSRRLPPATTSDFDDAVAAAGGSARERGFYTKPELVLVCEWKTARSKSRVAQNTAGFVERITGAALATDDERERMAALCVLRGVDVPSASVLLHFAFPDRYPIIDWRALESLGRYESPPYSIAYWLAYVDACRGLAQRAGVSMRVLNTALWQCSRERAR
jgi:hypothetical protein